MQAAFTRWRQDCRALFQTPELITDMPRLPCLPCPKGRYGSRPSHIGVCSHRLRKLYETSRLEEKELKEELELWHPNGAKSTSPSHSSDCSIDTTISSIKVIESVVISSSVHLPTFNATKITTPLLLLFLPHPQECVTTGLQFKPRAIMDLIGMMILAVFIHFFRNPTAVGWLVVIYCLYWDIRGIRSWLSRLAAEYMDPAV
ncbi:hypothetical protein KCU71_g2543, partial [Aureobasidium melanogenum]